MAKQNETVARHKAETEQYLASGPAQERAGKPEPKIGEGHAEAMLRLGFKELRNAINPSRESVADTEIGLYGSKTQGEIADDRDKTGKPQNSNEEFVKTHQHAGTTSEQFLALRAGKSQEQEQRGMEAQQKEREQGREM